MSALSSAPKRQRLSPANPSDGKIPGNVTSRSTSSSFGIRGVNKCSPRGSFVSSYLLPVSNPASRFRDVMLPPLRGAREGRIRICRGAWGRILQVALGDKGAMGGGDVDGGDASGGDTNGQEVDGDVICDAVGDTIGDGNYWCKNAFGYQDLVTTLVGEVLGQFGGLVVKERQRGCAEDFRCDGFVGKMLFSYLWEVGVVLGRDKDKEKDNGGDRIIASQPYFRLSDEEGGQQGGQRGGDVERGLLKRYVMLFYPSYVVEKPTVDENGSADESAVCKSVLEEEADVFGWRALLDVVGGREGVRGALFTDDVEDLNEGRIRRYNGLNNGREDQRDGKSDDDSQVDSSGGPVAQEQQQLQEKGQEQQPLGRGLVEQRAPTPVAIKSFSSLYRSLYSPSLTVLPSPLLTCIPPLVECLRGGKNVDELFPLLVSEVNGIYGRGEPAETSAEQTDGSDKLPDKLLFPPPPDDNVSILQHIISPLLSLSPAPGASGSSLGLPLPSKPSKSLLKNTIKHFVTPSLLKLKTPLPRSFYNNLLLPVCSLCVFGSVDDVGSVDVDSEGSLIFVEDLCLVLLLGGGGDVVGRLGKDLRDGGAIGTMVLERLGGTIEEWEAGEVEGGGERKVGLDVVNAVQALFNSSGSNKMSLDGLNGVLSTLLRSAQGQADKNHRNKVMGVLLTLLRKEGGRVKKDQQGREEATAIADLCGGFLKKSVMKFLE